MKITIDIKENKEGRINVTVNELKRLKNTKDSEFNSAINIFNVICESLRKMEGK